MKKMLGICKFSLYVLIFGLVNIPFYSFAENKQFDQNLVNAGKQKARKMKHNPVCIYVDKSGTVYITQSKFAIRNNQATFIDGDMVINVGKENATVWGVNLTTAEYGIVKNGKLEKSNDPILFQK